MRDPKRYSLVHEWNNDVMFESPEGPYVLYGEYAALRHAHDAALRQERDDWYNDASKHLLALCEKQGEVNGLEAQLAEVTVRRSETVAMCEHLRQRVGELEQQLGPQPHGPEIDPSHEQCLACTQFQLAAVTKAFEEYRRLHP